MMATIVVFGPAALAALKQAWAWRTWLIPLVLMLALGGVVAWARHLSRARDADAERAEQYAAAALSAEQAIDEIKEHQTKVDGAVAASHAAEIARLANSSQIRQGVAAAEPAPTCPPDPAVLHGLKLLRGEGAND